MCKCNMCGHEVPEHEEAKFKYQFGYFSKRDLDSLWLVLCPECLDKLADKLIRECKINPVEEYEPPFQEYGFQCLFVNNEILPLG